MTSIPEGKGRRAQSFAPLTRIDVEPFGPVTSREDREAALYDALRGVDLGRHDGRIIEWATSMIDVTTLRVIVSWLERSRTAAMIELINVEAALLRQRASLAVNGGL